MKIIVQSVTIETTEIFDIKEVNRKKTSSTDRQAGFYVFLIDKPPLKFYEDIPYETTARRISQIKDRWAALQEKVEEQWKQDTAKTKFFKLE